MKRFVVVTAVMYRQERFEVIGAQEMARLSSLYCNK